MFLREKQNVYTKQINPKHSFKVLFEFFHVFQASKLNASTFVCKQNNLELYLSRNSDNSSQFRSCTYTSELHIFYILQK